MATCNRDHFENLLLAASLHIYNVLVPNDSQIKQIGCRIGACDILCKPQESGASVYLQMYYSGNKIYFEVSVQYLRPSILSWSVYLDADLNITDDMINCIHIVVEQLFVVQPSADVVKISKKNLIDRTADFIYATNCATGIQYTIRNVRMHPLFIIE